MDFILKKYDSETSAALAKNVFLTGTPAKLPGLQDRVSSDLISIRPYKTETGVVMASTRTGVSNPATQEEAALYKTRGAGAPDLGAAEDHFRLRGRQGELRPGDP